MKKDKVFFAESGLTSTSANYIANMCKEMYKALESNLQSITFYTTEVSLLGSSEKSLIREGVKTISNVKDDLQTIAQLKSLIAWLREAIKAKERLISEAASSSYNDYGLQCPVEPVKDEYITEDDIISTWSIKQRNRYYYLETLCATIGGYIHPGERFATERENLLKVLHEPHEVEGAGRDTIIFSKTPSLPVNEVEDTFMELQNIYRGYQAELNSLKHSIEDALQKNKFEVNLKYQTDCNLYKDTKAAIDAELRTHIHNATMAAQNLKITIPDSLKPIYDKIQKLGK